jgi:PAS domain S-box-containing protein
MNQYKQQKQRLIENIFGSQDNFVLEHQCFNGMCFFAAGVFCISAIISVLIGLTLEIILGTLALGVVFWFFYFCSRVKGYFYPVYWFAFVFACLFICLAWFYAGGISGTATVVSLIVLAMINLITDKWQRIVAIFLLCVTLGLLYWIEFARPELIVSYNNTSTRFLDNYVTFFMAVLIISFVIHFTMQHFRFERKKVKDKEEKLQAILDNMPDSAWLKDNHLHFTMANKPFSDACHVPIPDIIGKTVFDIWPAKNADQFHKDDQQVLATGNRMIKEESLDDPQQGEKRLEIIRKPIMDQAGNISGIVGIARDITDARRVEAEKEKLQDQLTQAQKMESVGRLAGGVAHDFNNMLGVILGHAEFALEKAKENHDLYADLKEIQTAARRSADLTKQLLTFARKQIIAPKMLDLNDTVESILSMLRRLIGEDINLAWNPGKQLWPVKMDPSQVDQILANLCVNAKDAIAGVGNLTIETGMKTFDPAYCEDHAGFIPGDFVMLAVSDNGCGMDKEILNNLFEPFFTTKDVGEGTGLGLATVYGIVKQNNGFINVYSEPDHGTTFRIYLPRCVAADEIPAVVHPKKPDPKGDETILLVEDESAILRMTKMMLERMGYSVLPAATPAEAIDLAKTYADNIHLLMTDVVMPEMNGQDLAKHLTGLYPDIKLLFMSGYTANVIAHHGVLDEGVAFVQKPFSMKDLAEKVRGVLDKASKK